MRSESFFGFGIRVMRPWVKVGGRDSLPIHSKKKDQGGRVQDVRRMPYRIQK